MSAVSGPHDAFVKAGLRPKHVGVAHRSDGSVLVASGWHADGTPFAFVSKPFSGDPVVRAAQAAADLIAAHSGQPAPVAPIQQQERPAAMGKLSYLADRMKRVKSSIESEADALLKEVESAEKRAAEAISGHRNVLATVRKDVDELEASLAQMVNGEPAQQ